MRAEVRCCCDAKLLGWIEGVDLKCIGGSWIEFTLKPDGIDSLSNEKIDRVKLEVAPISSLVYPNNIIRRGYPPLTPATKGYLALKSNHLPLAVLRRIPSFTEYQE